MLTDREMAYVRWYDYFWFLIPIAGMGIFVMQVLNRMRNADQNQG